jgi:predicted DNA-binding transcriptional regulator AlpA
MTQKTTVPRVIRAGEAPAYLGIDRTTFGRMVRPHLIAVPMGTHAIGYDRLDLDAWWEQHKARHGRPGAQLHERSEQWDDAVSPDFDAEAASGTSTRLSTASEFAKALERVTGKKQRQHSQGS